MPLIVEQLEDRECLSGGLAAPTLLGLANAGPAQVSLSWTDVRNEAGFRVLRWNGQQALIIATVGPNVTSTTVSDLPAGHKVWLSVEAFNNRGTADSNWLSINLPVKPLVGATALTATAISASEVDLNWADGQGETGYRVMQWKNGHAELIATVAAGQHSAAVTGLDAGKGYFFRVETFNDSATTDTVWVSATTRAQPIAPPNHLSFSASDTQITLNWSAALGAVGYRVYQWDGAHAQLAGSIDVGTTSFTVTGLLPGTAYWFYVLAYNGSNTAATPWKVATTTATAAPLQAPGNLKAHSVGVGTIELDWATSSRAAGYLVYQWSGTTWSVAAGLPATATSFTLIDQRSGQSQWFLVLAYTDDFIESATSRIVACAAQ